MKKLKIPNKFDFKQDNIYEEIKEKILKETHLKERFGKKKEG